MNLYQLVFKVFKLIHRNLFSLGDLRSFFIPQFFSSCHLHKWPFCTLRRQWQQPWHHLSSFPPLFPFHRHHHPKSHAFKSQRKARNPNPIGNLGQEELLVVKNTMNQPNRQRPQGVHPACAQLAPGRMGQYGVPLSSHDKPTTCGPDVSVHADAFSGDTSHRCGGTWIARHWGARLPGRPLDLLLEFLGRGPASCWAWDGVAGRKQHRWWHDQRQAAAAAQRHGGEKERDDGGDDGKSKRVLYF